MKKNLFEMGAKLEEMQSDKNGKLIINSSSKDSSNNKLSQEPLFFKKEKRNGKVVTIIGRFICDDNKKRSILKLLKSKFGCGGTIDDLFIEIQGELQDKIKEILLKEGYKFRK
ncbi:MAG: translation initiation factor [Arcobacter butzleri]|nr:translation initiation factor [Aliarcobacter butzleri]